MIKRLKMAFFILAILFGAFLFAYGGYDDSPGAQGLGVLLTVGGIIGVIRINKKMMINIKMLNIVNNEDEIVAQASRDDIHRDGFLHREIHVYFITPNRQIIFQHRAKNKETYPDLLDATVGGHVEIGDSYLDTAIKEAAEETGLQIDSQELIFINKTTNKSIDQSTGKINNAIRTSYLFIFDGDIGDLKIESGQALGFELWSLDELADISDTDSQRFIPYILDFSRKELIKSFDQYVSKNN